MQIVNETIILEQVRGVCNADVSEVIHEVAHQIITELNKTAKKREMAQNKGGT